MTQAGVTRTQTKHNPNSWRILKEFCVNGSVAGVQLTPLDDLLVDTLYKRTDGLLEELV